MAPIKWGASSLDNKIDVGPSAPPMIQIDADSGPLNPKRIAPKNVIKIPI